ncbi:hypothetical protein FBU30_010742 [Linnemannia zychae]|nr:hypothetical protein FBU30_010742 [Linnemannia zychae]
MDGLIFPQPTPAPLILPRRRSVVHSSLRNQKFRQQRLQQNGEPGNGDPPLGGNEYTHTYYYPTSTAFPHSSPATVAAPAISFSQNATNTVNSPPPIFAFGGDRAKNGFVTATTYTPNPRFTASGGPIGIVYSDGTVQGPTLGAIQQSTRRHSVASSSPWTTIPPKHALHMPVMKVNPEIWRSENHQREIHRLLHENREEAIMRRRNMKAVMDTSEEGDEDNTEMSDVVLTMDLGGFKESEERENERIRAEVMNEWTRVVEQHAANNQLKAQQAEDFYRRRSWPGFIQQPQYGQAWRAQPGQYFSEQQQHQVPTQLPPPGLQYRSYVNGGIGPLDRGTWIGNGVIDTRRASFTEHRG